MAWATSRPGVAASRKAGTSARRRRSTQTGERPAGDAAPDAEAALPDRERPPPLVRDLVPAGGQEVDAAADPAAGEAPHRDLGASRAAVVVALRSTARRSHAAAAFASPRLSPFADGDERDEQRDGGVQPPRADRRVRGQPDKDGSGLHSAEDVLRALS